MLSVKSGQSYIAYATDHCGQQHLCFCCTWTHFLVGWPVHLGDQFGSLLARQYLGHSLCWWLRPLYCLAKLQLQGLYCQIGKTGGISYHSARAFDSISQVPFVHMNIATGICFAVQQVIEQMNWCEQIDKVDMVIFACDLFTQFHDSIIPKAHQWINLMAQI